MVLVGTAAAREGVAADTHRTTDTKGEMFPLCVFYREINLAYFASIIRTYLCTLFGVLVLRDSISNCFSDDTNGVSLEKP